MSDDIWRSRPVALQRRPKFIPLHLEAFQSFNRLK